MSLVIYIVRDIVKGDSNPTSDGALYALLGLVEPITQAWGNKPHACVIAVCLATVFMLRVFHV